MVCNALKNSEIFETKIQNLKTRIIGVIFPLSALKSKV